MPEITETLIRKLVSIGEVTDDHRQGIGLLNFRPARLDEGQHVVRDGEKPTECCLLIDGLLYRYKLLLDGGRQILAFHTPGEIPDLQSYRLRRMDHSLAAAVPSEVAFVSHESIGAAFRASPTLAELFWHDTLVDAAIFRAWLACMGRRDAHSHLAHLLCELFVRLRAVGKTNGNLCNLPLTQAELADAVGITTVHVNRTLQRLRREGLIHLNGSQLTILDWSTLQEVAEFDPSYLQLRTPI
jgi:CRP-like cAMP-binding protein